MVQVKRIASFARICGSPDIESLRPQPVHQCPANETARAGDENHAVANLGPQANPKTYCAKGKNPVCTTSSFIEKIKTL